VQTSELNPPAAAGQPAPVHRHPHPTTRPLGMWDDEMARPGLSLVVLVAWVALLCWLFQLFPWGFAA
jgi:hypothetical protein